MLKTIGIRAPNCWTNHDEPIIGSIKQPPSLRCSDAGLSDAGADDDGQKGQELMGVERSVWDVPCWMAFWCLLIDLHYMFPEIVDMDHVVVSWLVQFGLNLIHFEASHIIPNHTQNSKPYPNPPNHLKRCKISTTHFDAFCCDGRSWTWMTSCENMPWKIAKTHGRAAQTEMARYNHIGLASRLAGQIWATLRLRNFGPWRTLKYPLVI